jgi:hypothetical protein
MDPHLIDALWEVYREVGAREPIHVIGGYRTPATNAMLRRRSSGVAKSSQHMRGKAIDFFIPDVRLEAIREAGLRLQRGGVGFYPSSGAPFVHMDTGSVRHWPRIPEAQLARIMAKGPLTQVASNSRRPAANAQQQKSFLASLFGGGRDEDEDAAVAAPASGATETAAAPEAPAPTIVAAAIPLPQARPAARPAPAPSAGGGFELASATSTPVRSAPRPAQTASLAGHAGMSANDIINERGYWQGLVEPTIPQTTAAANPEPPRPPAHIPEFNGNVATGSVSPFPMPERRPTGEALAYAPPNEPVSTRIGPTGKAKVVARMAPRDTTVAVKAGGTRPAVTAPPAPAPAAKTVSVKASDRLNDPWMRAMVVAPNALEFMSTSLYGAPDFRTLQAHLQKPATSVMMTFSDDPHLGMSADRFKGHAVVFVATVTFTQRTAALGQRSDVR